MTDKKKKEKRRKDLHIRLMTYLITRGEMRGIKRHGSLHIKGRGNVWYVYPYRKIMAVKDMDDPDSKRVRAF